jgi:hypothetical protein
MSPALRDDEIARAADACVTASLPISDLDEAHV